VVTEAAALAAAEWMGRGDGLAADLAARTAMAAELAEMPIKARVVAGRGGNPEMNALRVGVELGSESGPWFTSSLEAEGGLTDHPDVWDLAADPLQAPSSLARGMDGALAMLAAGPTGSLMPVPEMYMQKLVVPTLAASVIDLDTPVGDNVKAVAAALGRRAEDLVVVVLDRPRHEGLIAQIKRCGARIRLITDGDASAGLAVATGDAGVDMYIGIGGSTEGILTAAALRCAGGEIQARFWPVSRHQVELATAAGIRDIEARLTTRDMAGDGVLVSATAVTGGRFLKAVDVRRDGIRTETLVLCSRCRAIRKIQTIHRSTSGGPQVNLGVR
jgi:fructose-1,6-bisphosphatase II